jgi:phage terminase Nu1 subunit (DNA packaging protein)
MTSDTKTEQSNVPNYPAKFYAQLFNLTERHIQRLAADGVIPKAARGQYPLLGSIRGYVKFLQERSFGKHSNETTDLQTEKIRLTKANADKTELEVAVLRGDLIPTEIVENVQGQMVSAARAKFLSIPTKAATQLTSATDLNEIQNIIKAHVYEALDEFSEFRPEDYQLQQLDAFMGESPEAVKVPAKLNS